MDSFDFMVYIKPELFILTVVVYAAGVLFKKGSVFLDRHIPIALGVMSVLLCSFYFLSVTPITSADVLFGVLYQSLIQGVLITACAVYGNQLVKQLGKKGE